MTSANTRITTLASDRSIHRAFHWLHLHEPQIARWHRELLAIPAPPFGEQPRAEWFLARFTELDLANPHIDTIGNALAELAAAPDAPVILLSAHLDTIFPAGTPCIPREEDGKLLCPGATDNGAGLAGLLAIAAALRYADITPAATILFAANVGEEGEGDLRGMRHLFSASPYAATHPLRHRARRRRLRHSRRPRPRQPPSPRRNHRPRRPLLGRRRPPQPDQRPGLRPHRPHPALTPLEPPHHAQLRNHLRRNLRQLHPLLRHRGPRSPLHLRRRARLASNPSSSPHSPSASKPKPAAAAPATPTPASSQTRDALRLTARRIGDRRAGALPPDSPLALSLHAVDRHLHLRTESRIGSTDANLPLSLNIPALAIGAGGTGGGIHTTHEWYSPENRELALRRILLLLLDTCNIHAQPAAKLPEAAD